MFPMVSIITPSYNKGNYIEKTILSVINQSYSNWELIIIDDASTDDTSLILKKFASIDERIKIHFNGENSGGNYCRNEGVRLAKGDFILFLDADDLLESFCLNQRINEVGIHSEYDLWVFPMGAFVKEIGDLDFKYFWIPPINNFLFRFLSNNLPWSILQPIWRKSFVKKINGFDPAFPLLQDVEIHTRALIHGARVKSFPSTLPDCFYRIDEQRLTTNKAIYIGKWVKGALLYYKKFYNGINNEQQKYISGTLLQVLGVVLYNKRIRHIDSFQYKLFKNELIQACLFRSHIKYFNFYVFFNRVSPFYPRGLKYIIKLLMKIST